MNRISPSILAADFSKLGSEIESVKNADYIHFDVMDGVFVPNISFGFPVLESVRAITDKTLDIHLMINSPSRYISRFVDAGGGIITFHVEAEAPESVHSAIDEIQKLGKKAGLSLKPETPSEALLPYISKLDMVLVMTVEPGYGGQDFIPEMLPKITEIRSMINKLNPDCELEVDGGINLETAKLCVNAGATVLVAGIDVFNTTNRAAHIEQLRNL
ncbi:MAG: ribulose-phosphate 3-epimerase [Oscillospiraceae bacterium]|nr:ribulose-phosphate 3-epimerase [Oscillospiraceae bacterium]